MEQNVEHVVSLRTQVLFRILEFQLEYGHGVGFNQLVTLCNLERTVVSKCHDSLSDMGLVEDASHLYEKDGETNFMTVMQINKHSLEFVKGIKDEVSEKTGGNIYD